VSNELSDLCRRGIGAFLVILSWVCLKVLLHETRSRSSRNSLYSGSSLPNPGRGSEGLAGDPRSRLTGRRPTTDLAWFRTSPALPRGWPRLLDLRQPHYLGRELAEASARTRTRCEMGGVDPENCLCMAILLKAIITHLLATASPCSAEQRPSMTPPMRASCLAGRL